jgi:hypothetical protein
VVSRREIGPRPQQEGVVVATMEPDRGRGPIRDRASHEENLKGEAYQAYSTRILRRVESSHGCYLASACHTLIGVCPRVLLQKRSRICHEREYGNALRPMPM